MERIYKQLAGITVLNGMLFIPALAFSNIVVDKNEFSQYHQKGVGIQISTDSLGIGFYSENHKYTIGGGISPYIYRNSDKDSSYIDYHVYGRVNFPLTNRTQFGLGVIAGNRSGKEDDKTINRDFNTGPYVGFEYAATKHILLGGFVSVFNYRTTKLSGESSSSTYTFFRAGSVQFAYLF